MIKVFSVTGIVCVSIAAGAFAADSIDFTRDIRPILSDQCFTCHGPDAKKRKADLRLDTEAGAVADNDGHRAIDRTDPGKSVLLERIFTDDPDEVMPPPDSTKKLTPQQRDLLSRWVENGAPWAEHWSFLPPKRTPGFEGIDAFVEERLDRSELKFSPEAARETLIRRVTLDLTGLPPTPAEVTAFLDDCDKRDSNAAYEALVDRLLKSPRYGERMTLAWMDAARYGDSSVMHADGPRDMWPWRDWVIRAYNSNKPFDTFTTEQLAGDLLPEATVDQKVASGFNRNHATSDEGGAIPEELRVEYVVDRVHTTSTVWLGLTMKCGQCHDHKYDPITQKEYYQFFSYFNNTTDPGMQTRRGNQAPFVEVVSEERQAKLAALQQRIDASQRELDEHRKSAGPAFTAWAKKASTKAVANQDAAREPEGLAHWFALDETNGNKLSNGATGAVATIEKGKLESVDREGKSRALKLNGGTQFKADVSPELEFDKPFSFALWIKYTGGNGAIFSKMDDRANYRGFDLWIQGKSIGTHIVNTWQSNALKVVSKDQLQQNKWQHVVVTYDGSHKQEGVKIYIDSKLSEHNVEANSLSATIATKQPFRIGSRSTSANFKGEIDDLRIYDRVIPGKELAAVRDGDPIQGILATPASQRTGNQNEVLLTHYLGKEDKKFKQLTAAHAGILKERGDLEQKPATTMVMQDNPGDKMRMTYVLERGHYESPNKEEEIRPGVPAALPPLPESAPPNRLGLAQWLLTPEHPLTARVAVNRYWAMFFGEGLVRTLEDFGSQGAPPTHPELLDWLAIDFAESGWDVKRTIRQIVMSRTYRQTSRISPELAESDPLNLLLGRGPRFRLQGEFIRDQALAVSGLLNEEIGGPGVKPYQPPNIWNEVSLNGGLRYPQDKGEKLYRRSIYTYWKRSAPMPNMLIFDAPTREKCVMRRPRTNTPLQALVTLNDPQFVEAARVLGERLVREGGATDRERIDLAYRLVTARGASESEISVLTDVLEEQRYRFKAAPEKAAEFLKIGEKPAGDSVDPVEGAAWAVVAQMVLNLDETLTRG